MVRGMLELTEQQDQDLEQLARLQDVCVEDLLARAVDSLLRIRISVADPTDEQRQRAIAAAGKYASGCGDLSVEPRPVPGGGLRAVSTFADTSALMAVVDRDDLKHAEALAAWERLIRDAYPLPCWN